MNDHTDPLVLPLNDHLTPDVPKPTPDVPKPTPDVPAAAASVVPASPATQAPIVVVAPVTTGRSFILKSYYNPHLRICQMLVKVSRVMPDAVIEVLEAFFPRVRPEKAAEHDHSRFFLGNLKADSEDYWILIFELRAELVQGGFPRLQYRMLHPSGRVFRPWDRLDLSVLKLRTTETHRAGISAMTGLIYMAPQEDVPKQIFETARPPKRKQESPRPHFKPGSRQMNSLFDRAGVTPSHVKKQLQPHAQVRSNLQRGLPASPAPAELPAARPAVDQAAIAELAAKAGRTDGETSAPAIPVAGSELPGGATESVVEIEATIVTTAPQPKFAPGEGDPVEANAAGSESKLESADAGRPVAADGVGA